MFTCRQFRELTGALLEGESHSEAYAHLAGCPRCRRLMDELAEIERAARTLPVYEPNPRLWARIETAAHDQHLWGRPSVWEEFIPAWSFLPARPAFAALLGMMLLVAAGLVSYPAMDLPMPQAAQASVFEVAQGELVQDASYGARYQKHLQQVEDRVLAEEAEPGDTELRALAARPLSTVDRCIGQVQLRLAEYPDDTLAREELLRLYRQKATVLQAMSDPVWMGVGQ